MQRLAFLLVFMLVFSAETFAQTTVSFQDGTNGYMGTEDTYVHEKFPATNFGGNTALRADGADGAAPSGEVATLLKWDVSSIPMGKTVTAATITLDFFNTSSGGYSVHPQNSTWTEGAAVWADLNTGTQIGTISPASGGVTAVALNAAGLALIEGWIANAANNFGVAIRTGGSNDGVAARSSESSAYHPKLEVTYADPGTGEDLQTRVENLETLVTALVAENTSQAALIAALQAEDTAQQAVDATHSAGIATNAADIDALEAVDVAQAANNTAQQAAIDAIDLGPVQAQADALSALFVGASRVGSDLFFDSMNVYVRNGLGATDGDSGSGPAVNGLGNLIVGYNEARSSGSDKTGSHNFVVGPEHNYTSYGGLLGGFENTASGEYSTVSGGQSNTASGDVSTVSGGQKNTASGSFSSASGGSSNTASGFRSSVSGGQLNEASGHRSSVSGGAQNTASEELSSVSGGWLNKSSGRFSSVSGGRNNTASDLYSVVLGGNGNTTSADDDIIPLNALATVSATHTTDIATNTAGIATNTAGIATNTAGIATNTASIATNVAGIATNAAGIATNTGNIATNAGDISALQAGNTTQTGQIDALNTLLSGASRLGDDLFFDSMNVHVRNGLGRTDGDDLAGSGPQVNGLGNLIVGYDEDRTLGTPDKTGSHNLIVGPEHNYPSYGGFLAGLRNTVSDSHASVSGGRSNEANELGSSVSGGQNNIASGNYSSVSGGTNGIASGSWSSVSGGSHNTASGNYSYVIGGLGNQASGLRSYVNGGWGNIASASNSSIIGGRDNRASGDWSNVSGGQDNTASGFYSSVSGGQDNTASGPSSSVSGGFENIASGFTASVSGGRNNNASHASSVVVGGIDNSSTGDFTINP